MSRHPSTLASVLSPFLRRVLFGGLLLSVVAAAASVYFGLDAKREAEALEQRQTARKEKEERKAKALFDDSTALIPDELAGLGLGLGLLREETLRLRPNAQLSSTATDREHYWYEETLSNGGRILLAFGRNDDRLAQMQALSILPGVDALTPHFTAMENRYGKPDGVWQCPGTDGILTQRFVWRHGKASLSDIVLGTAGRVSLTLYLAANETTARSLERGLCRPMVQAAPPEDPSS